MLISSLYYRTISHWWDLNPQPLVYKTSALPLSYSGAHLGCILTEVSATLHIIQKSKTRVNGCLEIISQIVQRMIARYSNLETLLYSNSSLIYTIHIENIWKLIIMTTSLNPTQIGDISEAMVRARFIQNGYLVFIPLNNGLRYDILVEKEGTFKRVQIKTGRLRANGTIKFNTSSLNPKTRNSQLSYYGEADWFAVYCPQTEKVYLLSVDESPPNHAYLRVEPTQNGQKQGIRWAEDYEF